MGDVGEVRRDVRVEDEQPAAAERGGQEAGPQQPAAQDAEPSVLVSGKYPGDGELTRLVGELCVVDDRFARLWAEGRVGECVAGTKRMTHPGAGEITVDFHLWAQSDRPEQRLEVYEVRGDEDGSRTRSLLDRTARLAPSRTASTSSMMYKGDGRALTPVAR